MRMGRVSLMVWFICSLGVLINMMFSARTTCFFNTPNCLFSLNPPSIRVKIPSTCLEGAISAKSLLRLTASSKESASANAFSRKVVAGSLRSMALHLR